MTDSSKHNKSDKYGTPYQLFSTIIPDLKKKYKEETLLTPSIRS